jgi:hypothetical protein
MDGQVLLHLTTLCGGKANTSEANERSCRNTFTHIACEQPWFYGDLNNPTYKVRYSVEQLNGRGEA